MPTQKTFKRRVRARMAKTGEAYTAARAQLLRQGDAPPPADDAPAIDGGMASEATDAMDAGVAIDGSAATTEAPQVPTNPAAEPAEMPTTEAALRRATGEGWDHWFGLLDGWGGTDRTHTEIARWLRDDLGVDGWWSQAITVGYERARGLRGKHEQRAGFAVGATRTVEVSAERALAAFTDPDLRRRWLPGIDLATRPTKAVNVARFDWPDPPSRLVVSADPKPSGRVTVAVQHERLPDAVVADELKLRWRGWLGDLKALLEGDGSPG